MSDKKALLSSIPSVDELLNNEHITKLLDIYPRTVLVDSIREYLKKYRESILQAEDVHKLVLSHNSIIDGIIAYVKDKSGNNLKNVINGTGVVLHTNLGRACISPAVIDNLVKISSRYSNLEMDLAKGSRGSRYDHVEEILCYLTKAEAAMVVNNNAAAVMLVLSTMAKDGEVIVSRGQLVEIGGSFRVPDVMAQSGAKLVEVGTTNKTHLWDYEKAIGDNTKALMKVHTSNYRIIGFTEEVKSDELVDLGRKKGIPVIEDLGSGMLIDLSKYGLPYEPTVQEAIASGMDVVTFSGDKMLGGPQAGIIVGKRKYIDEMKKNPLTRAFRIDKMTLAALEGTLKLYLDEQRAIKEIPVLRMLTEDKEEIRKRAEKLYNKLMHSLEDKCSMLLCDDYSEVGGGSMPMHKMPTIVISISSDRISVNQLENKLRSNETPIITRISKDRILIDMRTIWEDEFDIIEEALIKALE
ncbi:L-seryl-tRNA(Sec) selenium transferase [Lutispora thermophila]|uniref:L-seryl-tRNA(Sec) selenium transferase n=1 Tax=Lutispora thermophila DSM 19022 TaxID=1122184 RepID=A0A1M6DBC7_9FIRM|nr:L-seryl-tRNA(Sec) selenium transferase [Lutispora thermophila]SHI70348.1 L-seryl-tRNA(Sec) selenium transferase [Lutispora thermophila DSM 19022]